MERGVSMSDQVENYSSYFNAGTNNVFNRTIKLKEIVKGYGIIASTGVSPTANAAGTTEQVDFKLNIYFTQGKYVGEIYLVDYDTRRKYNSNKLLFFTGNENYCLCVFNVVSDDGCCNYNLIVEASPNRNTPAMLFAYSAPISNAGINIGGVISCGEILFFNEPPCYNR